MVPCKQFQLHLERNCIWCSLKWPRSSFGSCSRFPPPALSTASPVGAMPVPPPTLSTLPTFSLKRLRESYSSLSPRPGGPSCHLFSNAAFTGTHISTTREMALSLVPGTTHVACDVYVFSSSQDLRVLPAVCLEVTELLSFRNSVTQGP